MKIRELALIAFGPAAVFTYCSYFAYQYRNPYLLLAGLGVALGFGAVAWSHVKKVL